MYRFSRSIYRELAPRIKADTVADNATARHRILEACEATMRRMACDRRYFARPARTLFGEVREEFALADQVGVYMVIERYVNLALEHLERLPDDVRLDGQPRSCQASTRRAPRASASRCRGATTVPRTSTSRSPSRSRSWA